MPISRTAILLHKISQRHPQFLRGAKQAVLGRLLGRTAQLSDGAKLQALVMLQLEDHPFARIQIPERAIDPAPDLPSLQSAFGVKLRPLVGDGLKVLGLTFFARRSLYLTPAFLPPEVVQAHVHHHTIEPGGEAGIETEALERPVDFQES